MELFWHRRDLRVADNVGLAAATGARDDDRGPAAPVFVFDPDVLDHASDVRVRRLLDGLAALRADYRDRGSDLLVARGDPETVLPELAGALDADRVVWNRDYSGLARERDASVRTALNDAGIDREAHHDAVLHTPDSIRTNAGDPYSVYTYYWKKWTGRETDAPAPTPEASDLVDADALATTVGGDGGALADGGGRPDGGVEADRVAVGDLPSPADLGFAEPDADIGAAGTEAARDRLDAFLSEAVFSYDAERDYPAREATSRMSAFLKYGEIGVREVYEATERATAAAEERTAKDDEAADGDGGGSDSDDDEGGPVAAVEEYQQQLAWREFYAQVLFHNPEVVTENYKTYEEGIAWRDDAEEIAAWKRGETGYPIVDAGMRQLREEAFMHNRVRMIVASFLTKDLLADWRHGYEHFRETLADHDTANDNGGWQWAASTGTDAQPYFRIFNPMTQGERYDPEAEYITEYVPELRGLDADLIHEWHELSPTQRANAAPEYPSPIVDHSERREEALAMYKRARGEDPEE
ncbi:cryptochrome/photolyase family protein [Halorubrum lipolyticum]|uniref:Deoxyribodipyrimidine photolyase n=1 Tax=Halorubrum lipolyticum DSM 21995 TaxID=1227482 RepID=M0P3Q2_9EURY|nr:deoxyribodipyrimidine photo-lyase [Halorubrum lipolyticum]EMA64159.1 deoxyribodipyrimidine photolyase [Halorubrum lipolyticum DSM 21995]